MNEMRAWHFLRNDRRLGYDDGRFIIAGETLSVDPPIELCEWGMHASRRIIDALPFATGPLISRVILSGDIQHSLHGEAKSVALSRKTLWILDCTEALRRFSRWAAAAALTKTGITDERSWATINANALWHAGKLTDKELAKIREAALRAVSAAALGHRRATEQMALNMALRLVSDSDTINYKHTTSGSAYRTAQHMRSRLYALHTNRNANNLIRRANIMLTREIMKQYRQELKPNA